MSGFDGPGRRVVVTGAAGFIGRAVVDRIDAGGLGLVSELVLNDVSPARHPSATIVPGTFADESVRRRLLERPVDILFHLASVPGGASAHDPQLGRSVNLDGSIALLDAMCAGHKPVVVYASSIAALGGLGEQVDDRTPCRPSGSYGTHKAMIELYLADLTRRGLVDGRSLRPAGIVARPKDAFGGFATAWMSDLFYAALERRSIALPLEPSARIWLQSIDVVAANFIHAALMPSSGLVPHRIWTLPATVVRVESLVAALQRQLGHGFAATYLGGAMNLPELDAAAAVAAGFTGDGPVEALAQQVIAGIRREMRPVT